jgi:hypothetical protein
MDRALSGRSLKLLPHYHNDKLRRRRCLGADANANSFNRPNRPKDRLPERASDRCVRRGSFSHSNGRIGKVAVPGEPPPLPKGGRVHARVSISRGRRQKSTCHDPAMACAIITTHLAARIISSWVGRAHNNAL